MDKLTLEETIAALKHQAEVHRAVDVVLAMTDEEIEQDLISQGIDVVALDARLAAMEQEIGNEQYKLTKGEAVAAFLAEERADEIDARTSRLTREQAIAQLEVAGISRQEQATFFVRLNRKLRDALRR